MEFGTEQLCDHADRFIQSIFYPFSSPISRALVLKFGAEIPEKPVDSKLAETVTIEVLDGNKTSGKQAYDARYYQA